MSRNARACPDPRNRRHVPPRTAMYKPDGHTSCPLARTLPQLSVLSYYRRRLLVRSRYLTLHLRGQSFLSLIVSFLSSLRLPHPFSEPR